MIADLKTARLRVGLNRHEFARRVGVSAVAVWKWEQGINQPTDEHWRAIEQVLRAKAAYDQTCKDTSFPPKLMRWETAVYGWATAKYASQGCVDAAAKASAYMVQANKRLTTARDATDLESDSTARALMSAAARACGKELP